MDSGPKPNVSFNRDDPQWPMSYALSPTETNTPPRRWWRHYYYRGPRGQSVQVLYSKTKSQSEAIARSFANEPVLGFDMEWPWDAERRPRLQDKVALIQLASERRVALFHIALHQGETVEDLIAPTLKEILESPIIIKAGVAVINADFRRLKNHFALEPKGAFELSHLHNLITYGATSAHQVTTKLRALSAQVEQHLGLPLWKGNTRTSDWSLPLNPSQSQYAATDAYACFMLFHCMNAKRLSMDPVPPFPQLAEKYLPSSTTKSMTLQLESRTENGDIRIITAKGFFSASKEADQNFDVTEECNDFEEGNMSSEAHHEEKGTVQVRKTSQRTNKRRQPDVLGDRDKSQASTKSRRARNPANPEESSNVRTLMDSSCRALFDRLVLHRRGCAASNGLPPFVIAHNSVLEALTLHRPSNDQKLLLVPGIGKRKVAEYGPAWLEIIRTFEAEQKQCVDNEPTARKSDPSQHRSDQIELEHNKSKRRRVVPGGSSEEILVPSGNPPALSTGLSFQFSETTLNASEYLTPPQVKAYYDSDDDSAFGPPMELPPASLLKQKRANTLSSTVDDQPSQSAQPTQMPASMPVPTTPAVKPEPASEPITITNFDPTPLPEPVPISAAMPTAEASSPAVPLPVAAAAAQLAPPKRPDMENGILRKKLEAYIKGVVWAAHPRPTQPLVSGDTLDCLVTTLPRTIEEFSCVPGMQQLIQACKAVNKDIWRTFEMWTRSPRPAANRGQASEEVFRAR
ncbi:hypothetical protein F5Y19DRAFT_464395 [Xylariaceae sp. FL1651]|nr:hypothetical protein F5Y19DRAFT_464395 [Xylariaceae sp. FL1651]